LGLTAEYQATHAQWFRCDWQSYFVYGEMLFAMTINAGTPLLLPTFRTFVFI
jgi:hypothetical protein